MINEKVGKLQTDINDVKTDQERLIRKSNQIRTGHRKLINITKSEQSLP